MSKFITMINTFKNGMVSPRLRGAVVQPDDRSSAEVLENFYVDRTGAAIKRPGLVHRSVSDYVAGLQHFKFTLLGDEYLLRFNPNEAFNSGNYLNIYKGNAPSEIPLNVFGKGLVPITITSWLHSEDNVILSVPLGHGFLPLDTIYVSGLVATGSVYVPNGAFTVYSVTPTAVMFKSVTRTVTPTSWTHQYTNPTNGEHFIEVGSNHANIQIGEQVRLSGGYTAVVPSTGATYTVDGLYTVTNVSSTYLSLFTTNPPPATASAHYLGANAKVTVYGMSGTPTVLGAVVSSFTGTSLGLWNERPSTTGSRIFSGLTNYLDTYLHIKDAVQVSESSIVFTTSQFSFTLSILDYPNQYTRQIVRAFYLLPYFVSITALQNTLNKIVTDATTCPILPSNFPFDPVNTDSSLSVSVSELLDSSGNAQAGSAITVSALSKSNEKFIFKVSVPTTLRYINTVSTTLTGRFISIINASSTESVFFLTKENNVTATTTDYLAIQIIGGVISGSSTAWKLSSWGDSLHPKVVGFAFNRLMYANTKDSESKWWASALHPDNTRYFQGFMTNALKQDLASNVSGMNYAGVTTGFSTLTTPNVALPRDIYRFGFSDKVPTRGAINWITSRRRIHLGTTKGEAQITVEGGTYSAASYSQNITGTDKSAPYQITEGNRKVFYLANDGKDIRVISTEDKDYESLDSLYSVSLEGLNIYFKKIQWVEELSGVLCLTRDNRVFLLTVHSDTGIKAFSEFTFTKEVLDFAGTSIILRDGDYAITTELLMYSPDNYFPLLYGDIYSMGYDKIELGQALANFYGKDVFIYFKGVVYPFTVPSTSFVPSYPFNDDEISEEFPAYVFENVYAAKLKTLPLNEGARFGSAVGDVHRVDRISVLVDNSGPFKYGADENNLLSTEGIGVNDTKIVTVDFPQSPDREQFVYIESSDPTPLNISGISLRGVSYSGE